MGEPVPETKKVTDFLAGITDSRLTNAKDIVLGNPQYLSNFEACQQYLATLVGNKMEHAKIERQISEIKVKKKGGGPSGDKDKGRGKEKDKKLHAGGYSWEEWKRLGPDGQAKVRALRKTLKKKRKAEIAQIDTDVGDNDDAVGGGGDEETQAQFGRAAHRRRTEGGN